MSRKYRMVWNLPNVLTLLRMALIPVFCTLMYKNRMRDALIVFLAASITDVVDGYLARTNNEITDFGKLMDPMADKLMTLSLMISLCLKGIAPKAAIIILLIKEGLMGIGSIYLLKREKVVYSKFIGKLAQFVNVCALLLCFFHQYFQQLGVPVHLITLWIGVFLSVCAFFFYARTNFEGILFKKRKGG